MIRNLGCTFACVCVLASLALADDARQYDVRLLISATPDFKHTGLLNPAAEPVEPAEPADTEPTREQLVSRLIESVKLITGDGAGISITEKEGTLHVVAPADRQARVKAALAEAVRQRSMTIMVECRFVATEGDLHTKADPELAPLLDRAALGESVFLTERQASLVMRDTQLGKGAQMSTPRVTLFQNQEAYVLTVRQIAYVAGFNRVQDPQAAERFEPEIDVAQPGTLLQVRASAHADGSVIALQLKPQRTVLRGIADQPWPNAPAGQAMKVQVPDLLTYQANRLISLPAGQSALIRLSADKASPELNYVLVTARIVPPRD